MPDQPEVNPAAEASERVYRPSAVERDLHAESTFTRLIEQQSAKMPSDVFLFGALGAMGASLLLQLLGRHQASRFVGMWPPTLLIMGLYNKVVKLGGTR